MKEKDYDAIARGAQEDDTWSIFSVQYDKDGKPWRFEITGGINGEGSVYTVSVIEGKERADEICEAHNATILRKHDEAEASGEQYNRPADILAHLKDYPGARDRLIDLLADECWPRSFVADCFAKYDEIQSRPAPTDEKALIKAAQAMLNSYKEAHDSGDWGNWDLEQDREYVNLRSALLAHEASKDESKEGGR